jgi:hypothetical protein
MGRPGPFTLCSRMVLVITRGLVNQRRVCPGNGVAEEEVVFSGRARDESDSRAVALRSIDNRCCICGSGFDGRFQRRNEDEKE